jgi:hypothetical protein
MNKNKAFNILIGTIIILIVCQIGASVSQADKANLESRVKSMMVPAQEVRPTLHNVAMTCPRAYASDDLQVQSVTTAEGVEYDHCRECGMGVYFSNGLDSLSCSYCNSIKKG